MDHLEIHAFGVQFNLIDRECILNLKEKKFFLVCGVVGLRMSQMSGLWEPVVSIQHQKVRTANTEIC